MKPTLPRGQGGFTLLEILIVVAILGILATIIVPKIMKRPEEARRTKAKIDIKAIETALNLYRLDNGVYPSTEQGLEALVTKPTTGVIPKNWNEEGYLDKDPNPDVWREGVWTSQPDESTVFLAGKEYENLELIEYELDSETEKFAPDHYFFEDKRARWVK